MLSFLQADTNLQCSQHSKIRITQHASRMSDLKKGQSHGSLKNMNTLSGRFVIILNNLMQNHSDASLQNCNVQQNLIASFKLRKKSKHF